MGMCVGAVCDSAVSEGWGGGSGGGGGGGEWIFLRFERSALVQRVNEVNASSRTGVFPKEEIASMAYCSGGVFLPLFIFLYQIIFLYSSLVKRNMAMFSIILLF